MSGAAAEKRKKRKAKWRAGDAGTERRRIDDGGNMRETKAAATAKRRNEMTSYQSEAAKK